ncbi:hypothetical protein GCM10027341_10680 [Spirosoma knui]
MMFEPATQSVAFVLPSTFLKAELTFTRTPDSLDDIRVPITPGQASRYVVSTARLSKGRWRARLNWSTGQQQYHDEQDIFV